MGASVGVGGLIIGISMLVVFSMAVTTLSNQTATSMEALESAQTPNPIITINNANVTLFAVNSIQVTFGGASNSYDAGFLTSESCEGFNASFTVATGVIENNVAVNSAGSCLEVPTDMVVENQADEGATLLVDTNRQFFANLTNAGAETISTDTSWIFFDGEFPRTLASANFVVEDFDNWFSGETIELFWDEPNAFINLERLSLTVGETSVSRIISSTPPTI